MAKTKYYILDPQMAGIFQTFGATIVPIGNNPSCVSEEEYDVIKEQVIIEVATNENSDDDYMLPLLNGGLLNYLYWSTEQLNP